MSEPEPTREVPRGTLSGRQTYNLVTDTVAGPNVRLRDNLYQGLVSFACGIVGAIAGCFLAADPLLGMLGGALAGLFVGLVGTGTFLMVYRLIQHSRGRHD